MVKRMWQRSLLGKLLADQGRQQRWVARRIGLDEGSLSKILDGQRPCSPERAAQIAALLAIPVEFFYRDGRLLMAMDTGHETIHPASLEASA